MGAVWLQSLPRVLTDAGLIVDTWPGWEVRARSTGGYDGVFAVQVHHTASLASPEADMAYMWEGSPDRPVGAIYLARDGRVTVGAAGATNTSGKGGPRNTIHGTIPLDSANKYVISIEAGNAGTGEPWPPAQQDAYVILCAALNAAYGLSVGDVHSHREWTIDGRKIDPAGNSRYATGGSSWNMDAFRGDVFSVGNPLPPPTPPPTTEEDTMLIARDSTTGKIWIGNFIEKMERNDDDANAVISMAAKSGTPLRDASTGRAVDALSDVSDVSDRTIRLLGTAPG